MLRNTAQKLYVYAWDKTNNVAKTGDAANISAYIFKDGGSGAATNDAAPSEVDSTNAPGVYAFDLTATETDCTSGIVVPKSSTSGIHLDPVGFVTQDPSLALLSGTAQAGATTYITLAAATVSSDDDYVGSTIVIYAGTGKGQVRIIESTLASNQRAYPDQAFVTAPDSTSKYIVVDTGADVTTARNLARSMGTISALITASGTHSTTVVQTDATAADFFYSAGLNRLLACVSGTNAGQVASISSYLNANGEFTLTNGFTDAAVDGDTFIVI